MSIDINASDYFYTEAIEPTPEQRRFLRRHRVTYSGPGLYGGIRQYETFCGGSGRPSVHVHPSFPAEPEVVHRAQHGIGHTWRTSDRKAAVAIARRWNAERKPTHPSHAYKAQCVPLMIEAAKAVAKFAHEYFDGSVLTTKDGYAEAAQALYQAVNFRKAGPGSTYEENSVEGCTTAVIGSLIWPNAWSYALGLTEPQRYRSYALREALHAVAASVGWYLLRWAEEGWLPYEQAWDLAQAASEAAGHGR